MRGVPKIKPDNRILRRVLDTAREEFKDAFRYEGTLDELEKALRELLTTSRAVYSKARIQEMTKETPGRAYNKFLFYRRVFELLEEKGQGVVLPGERRPVDPRVPSVGSVFIWKSKHMYKDLLEELQYRANFSSTWTEGFSGEHREALERLMRAEVRREASRKVSRFRVGALPRTDISFETPDKEGLAELAEREALKLMENDMDFSLFDGTPGEREDLEARTFTKVRADILSALTYKKATQNLLSLSDERTYVPEGTTPGESWSRMNLSDLMPEVIPLEDDGGEILIPKSKGKSDDEILEELPVKVRNEPYVYIPKLRDRTIPSSYATSVARRISSLLSDKLSSSTSIPHSLDKGILYAVPEGYWEGIYGEKGVTVKMDPGRGNPAYIKESPGIEPGEKKNLKNPLTGFSGGSFRYSFYRDHHYEIYACQDKDYLFCVTTFTEALLFYIRNQVLGVIGELIPEFQREATPRGYDLDPRSFDGFRNLISRVL